MDVENVCSFRLSVLMPSDLCKFSSRSRRNHGRLCKKRVPPRYRVVGDGVKRLHEVHHRGPHFDSPLLAFLFQHSVCRKMIRCLVSFSESRLIFCLFLVKHWEKSSIQNCREQFVTLLVMSKSGGNCPHSRRHLSCVSL